MGFNPGPGGSSSSIAGSTDVTLSSPQDDQVLTYDSGSAKWQNQAVGGTHEHTSGDISDFSEAVLDIVDGSGGAVPAHGHDASDITSGELQLARMPSGSTIVIDKSKEFFGAPGQWPASRPTNRHDICVIWVGDTDPGSIALAGDKWDLSA